MTRLDNLSCFKGNNIDIVRKKFLYKSAQRRTFHTAKILPPGNKSLKCVGYGALKKNGNAVQKSKNSRQKSYLLDCNPLCNF